MSLQESLKAEIFSLVVREGAVMTDTKSENCYTADFEDGGRDP